jgi:hypothetical protein
VAPSRNEHGWPSSKRVLEKDQHNGSAAGIGTDEINPNIGIDTQVAVGLGHRDQVSEELPLSTRVHELAKELGLKSQELIERIQKWGLDVKANALASLDPPMVDRIRELMDQPMDREGATSPALPDQGVTAPPPPSVPPRAGSSGESDAVTKAPKPAGSAPAPPSMVRTEPDPGHAAA